MEELSAAASARWVCLPVLMLPAKIRILTGLPTTRRGSAPWLTCVFWRVCYFLVAQGGFTLRLINKNILNTIIRNKLTTKKESCSKENSLMIQFLYTLSNFFEYTERNMTAYELALWIKSKNNMLSNKGKSNAKIYSPKMILNVDLGNNTYGTEFSYIHPCVVVYSSPLRLFIVPCSSSQLSPRDATGNILPGFLEGDSNDGFLVKTTVKLKEARFIDTARVVGELNPVTDVFFNTIYSSLFSILFEFKYHSLSKLEAENVDLHNKIDSLLQEKEILLNRLEAATIKNNSI
jgi:hypothetical protein